jgi:DNA-binding winged helix-turn-helix (wHTH) protein/Tol biopolymer transport system component
VQDAVQPSELIRFGTFEVDLEAGELRRNGRKIRLTGQPFQVLAILLEHPGRVVTREELQKRLWPDTVVEVEHSLNTAINKIRDALDDTAENPRFVETLPRRGYRFIAPLWAPPEPGAGDSDCPPEAAAATGPPETDRTKSIPAATRVRSHRNWMVLGGGVAALLAALALAAWILRSPLRPPRITDYVQLTNDGRARTIGGTDANKLFVNTFQPDELAQVSISDGRSAPFRIDVPNAKQCQSAVPTVRDVSSDGSLLLVLCYAGLYENQVWIVGALGRPARLLITAQDATLSADGKSVVYSTPEGAIYRIPSAGGESRLLVPAMVQKGQVKFARDLACAPNGKSIRFTTEQAIWEVSANGENLHRLLSPARWTSPSCCGRWTPNGDLFVFIYGQSPVHHDLSQHAAEMWAIDERYGRLRRPNAEPFQIMPGPLRWADPIPSRDGKHIFSRGVTLRGELARYDPQSKQLQPYLGNISAVELAFSRDGNYVAYVTFPDGILWRANLDGSNVVQLTQPSKNHVAMPSWSPDGSQITYLGIFGQGQSSVFSIPSKGGFPRALLPEPNEFDNDPNWSPDGKEMVFARFPADVNFPINVGDVKIKIVDLETHQISVLLDSKATFSPRWSPNGRYIAGLRLPDSEVRVYDLKTQKWLPLAKSANANYPAWSKDSRFIYAECFGEEVGIYRLPITGGPAELVLDLTHIPQTGWWGFWFGLDPTDAPLVLRDAGAYEIYALTLDRE